MDWQTIGIVLLGLIGGTQVFLRPFFVRSVRIIFVSVAAFAILWSGRIAFLQYVSWAWNPFSAKLLPPYQPWSYFIRYVLRSSLAGWSIATIVCILVAFLIMRSLNARYGYRFFEREEPYIMGIGALLVGYPGIFIYAPLMFGAGMILSLIYALTKQGRAPLYFLWIPVAISTILLMQGILPRGVVDIFIF
jgi:hypothetical protein